MKSRSADSPPDDRTTRSSAPSIPQPPKWCSKYVGLPFRDKGRDLTKDRGFDCWGLVRFVLADRFKITGLPDYGEAYIAAHDKESVQTAIKSGLVRGWRRLKGEEQPQAGDLIIINIAGRPFHCAIAVCDPGSGGDWMLHVVGPEENGPGSILERWTREPWKNRIEGFYRHV